MDAKLITSFEYDGQCIELFASKYTVDDTKAIFASESDGSPYAVVTVNLSDYGFELPNDTVVVKHDIIHFGNFCDKIFEVLGYPEEPKVEVRYGFATSFLLKLRPEFLEFWDNEED